MEQRKENKEEEEVAKVWDKGKGIRRRKRWRKRMNFNCGNLLAYTDINYTRDFPPSRLGCNDSTILFLSEQVCS